MKWQFEEDGDCSELQILLTKNRFDLEVEMVIQLLEQAQVGKKDVVPIKTADRIQLLKIKDMIAAEVDGNDLVITTISGVLRTPERLYKFKDNLSHPDIIQVSKQSLINISHLEYLEDSFSGNMAAFLTGKVKIGVSRRYLKDLEIRLGIR